MIVMVPFQLPGSRRRSKQYRWRERSFLPTLSNTNSWRNSSRKRGAYNQWCTLSFPLFSVTSIPREEEAGCKLEPLLCCHVSWVDLSQGKKLEGHVAAVF